MPADPILLAAVFAVALLYACVGHAGASGYIAVMTLLGLAPGVVRPTALILNVLVATIGSIQYARAGHFSWTLFWPFAVLSVPLAFVGGYTSLPIGWFRVLVGLVLLFSAARFVMRSTPDPVPHPPTKARATVTGGALGLLAGLTGTGGGIFLTPLLLICEWSTTKRAAATSAVFILVNSIAGLAGNFSATHILPAVALPLALTAAFGGTIGSHLGSRRFDPIVVKRLLAAVLLVAGLKLVFT